MNTYKASNVPLNDFKSFLEKLGAKCIRITDGHYIYAHSKLQRPIPLQTHVDPVPQFIVLEVINYFEMSSEDMWKIIKPGKGTSERKEGVARKGKRSVKKELPPTPPQF